MTRGPVDPGTVEARYQNPAVVDVYDAARFEGLRGRYNNWRMHRVLKSIMSTLPPAETVLDMPCGTGRLLGYLTRSSRHVIAADVSGEMLTVARRKGRPGPLVPRFLRADARHLPFRSSSVDVVFSVRFLHLLDRDARIEVLRELTRVSRRSVVVEYRSVTKLLRVARHAVLRWVGKRNLPRRTTMADVVDELKTCGLVAERRYFTNRFVSGSVIIAARR